MVDPKPLEYADLNEFGLPRHGDGVGPTLRPDLIAERHLHDWDRPEQPLAPFPEILGDEAGLAVQMLAHDRLHRARASALPPTAADFAEVDSADAPGGDNEQQCARRAHALAQNGGEAGP
jgi:hypothetical protein